MTTDTSPSKPALRTQLHPHTTACTSARPLPVGCRRLVQVVACPASGILPSCPSLRNTHTQRHAVRPLLQTPHGQGSEQLGTPDTAQHPFVSPPQHLSHPTNPAVDHKGWCSSSGSSHALTQTACTPNPAGSASRASRSRPGTGHMVYRHPDHLPRLQVPPQQERGTHRTRRQSLNGTQRSDNVGCISVQTRCAQHDVCAAVTSPEGATHTYVHTQTCCDCRSWRERCASCTCCKQPPPSPHHTNVALKPQQVAWHVGRARA